MSLTLTIFDTATLAEREQVLPMSGTGDHAALVVRRVPGADAAHLRFTATPPGGQATVFRMEIPAPDDSEFPVTVSWGENGYVTARSPGRDTYYLPAEPAYGPEAPEWIGGPLAPIVPPSERHTLDLVFLVDATVRHWRLEGGKPASVPLLGREAAADWSIVVDKLMELAAELGADYEDIRVATVAFADEAPGPDVPTDIKPAFLLYPSERSARQLAAHTIQEVQDALIGLPATSGADYVDALGEALLEVSRLAWAADARRILILLGDSPGYSVRHPAPWGADARVRRVDVDTEAARLHRLGVEVLCLIGGPGRELGLDDPGRPSAALLQHTREQYRRLASRTDFCVPLFGYSPSAFAELVRAQRGALARGPTWPCLIRATAISAEYARRPHG